MYVYMCVCVCAFCGVDVPRTVAAYRWHNLSLCPPFVSLVLGRVERGQLRSVPLNSPPCPRLGTSPLAFLCFLSHQRPGLLGCKFTPLFHVFSVYFPLFSLLNIPVKYSFAVFPTASVLILLFYFPITLSCSLLDTRCCRSGWYPSRDQARFESRRRRSSSGRRRRVRGEELVSVPRGPQDPEAADDPGEVHPDRAAIVLRGRPGPHHRLDLPTLRAGGPGVS